jgi:undecaprenyl diphosphate synthase
MIKFRQAQATTKKSTQATIEPESDYIENPPQHVAIIMDGNGRWASRRGLPRIAGHRAGAENIRRIVESSVRFGVKYLTLYAFSTENWRRPEDEVSGLMSILGEVLERETPKLHAEGVKINHLGRIDRISPHLCRAINEATALTCQNSRLVLNVCFNYGGRGEIVDAVRQIVAQGIPADQVDETMIGRFLYSNGSPDPDLIIRTAGEQRMSNFLIWQSAYSEYWFTPLCWPDFGRGEYKEALLEFSSRLRKFGKTPDQVKR